MVLLPVQTVDVKGEHAKLFWDDGSTGAMLTYRKANRLGLRGREVMYEMQTIDNDWKMVKEHLFEVGMPIL